MGVKGSRIKDCLGELEESLQIQAKRGHEV